MNNGFDSIIEVVNCTIEDYKNEELEKQKVDVLVSEPLGIMLFHERMLESFLIARDRFLKKDGIIFPTKADFYAIPFCDYEAIENIENESAVWDNISYFGYNVTPLKEENKSQLIKQPQINGYDSSKNISTEKECHTLDFRTMKVQELLSMQYDYDYTAKSVGLIHGVAFWFDAKFEGTQRTISLSTSPYTIFTHWYQTRILLQTPVGINTFDKIHITVKLDINKDQSYYINLSVALPQINV